MNNIAYIKANANVKAILEYLGIIFTEANNSYRSPCPIHGGKHKNSFDINSETGMWFCHTKCKRGGDIIELIQQVKQCNFYKACEIIAATSGFTIDGIEFTKDEITDYEEANKYFKAFNKDFEFDKYSFEYQEMFPVEAYRGLTQEILEEYEVFFSKEFMLSNSITRNRVGFPIYLDGQLIGVDLRATRVGDNIKWLRQPKGLSCGHTLYNYDKICKTDKEFVIVVEGIFDVLMLTQFGYPTLGTFGASVTDPQTRLLENLGLPIYIAYDGDEAGLLGANQVYRKLHNTCDIYFIKLPIGVDPGSIDKESFDELFASSKIMRKEIEYEI